MSVHSLTRSQQNYLKAIWALGEWNDEPVTSKAVAERVGVSASTASEALDKLHKRDLIDKEPYSAITLTPEGETYAVQMVRRHRLIETFLVTELGYRWDQVHDEAEVLEHAISDLMIERIDQKLDRPQRDPHGDPIPDSDGTLPAINAVRLDSVTGAVTVKVERISDDDPTMLQFLESEGIGFGSVMALRGNEPFSDEIRTRVNDRDVTLSPAVTRSLWVSLDAHS